MAWTIGKKLYSGLGALVAALALLAAGSAYSTRALHGTVIELASKVAVNLALAVKVQFSPAAACKAFRFGMSVAVEAARAGEAGMGFAVVADEVRSLAHAQGINQVSQSVAQMEKGTQTTAATAEETAAASEELSAQAKMARGVAEESFPPEATGSYGSF